MSRLADDTRARLVDAATRVFAEQGVQGGSLLEITRLAGQRNRGAVHYHFGSREGILVALLDEHTPFLAKREAELLEAARQQPDDDITSVIEAIVRPAVELTEIDWRGACFLRILRDLVEQDPLTLPPEVQQALQRTGGFPVYELMMVRMEPLSKELETERIALVTYFILQSIADRASILDRPQPLRPTLPTELFIANLVAMASGMLSAPLP